jgi:hypothetical protein
MRRLMIFPLLTVLCLGIFPAGAATGRVIKMLPFFIDLEGKHMRSPNLYDRDNYQVYLRKHPAERSGMRFDVQWKTKGKISAPLKVKLELRGGVRGGPPLQLTLEVEAKPSRWFSTWTSLPLLGDDYKKFGEVIAWRATLWEGDQLIGEQKSFLW